MHDRPLLIYSAIVCTFLMTSSDSVAEPTIADCRDVLVPNEIATSGAKTAEDKFYDAMCGDWYTSHKETVDAAASASFVIDAVPMNANGSYASTSQNMTRTQFCAQKSRKVAQSTRDQFYSRIVSDSARNNWTSCVEKVVEAGYKDGPHPIKTTTTATSTSVVITARFDKNFNGDTPQLKGLESTNLTCNSPGSVAIPSEGDGVAISCSWKYDDADSDAVIVRTSRGDEVVRITRKLPPTLTLATEIHTPELVPDSVVERCSTPVTTVDMAYWKVAARTNDARCSASSSDGVWCKGTYSVTLDPKLGASLSLSTARLSCGLATPGTACGWNALDAAANRTFSQNGSSIRADFAAGSTPIAVSLCAQETTYKSVDKRTDGQETELGRGAGFVVELPSGSTGALNLKWGEKNKNNAAIKIGEGNDRVSLVSQVSVGSVTKYSYRVNK